jgi:cytosine/adenosine deaminase-related metal-dependent hydrolase
MPAPDRIFTGSVITMNAAAPIVDAVGVTEDRITFAGSAEEAMGLADATTVVTELGEGVLLPGFLDAHEHITTSLKSWVRERGSAACWTGRHGGGDRHGVEGASGPAGPTSGDWLVANGYDDSVIEGNVHPTKFDLDRVSTEVPIAIDVGPTQPVTAATESSPSLSPAAVEAVELLPNVQVVSNDTVEDAGEAAGLSDADIDELVFINRDARTRAAARVTYLVVALFALVFAWLAGGLPK